MELGKFKFKMDRVHFENVTFRIVSTVLATLVGVLTFMLIVKTEQQRTIFIPPGAYTTVKPFWVAGDRVSSEYLEMMGMFLSSTFLNITIETAGTAEAVILSFVRPEVSHEVRHVISKQADELLEMKLSRLFYPVSIDYGEKGKLKVSGIQKDMVGDKVVRTDNVILSISYNIEHGRFWLYGIGKEVIKK